MSVLSGQWKRDGYIVPVPVKSWPGIRLVKLYSATARRTTNSSLFCVVFPVGVADAEEWLVTVEPGVLSVKPPVIIAARVKMQAGEVNFITAGSHASGRLAIGLILPRRIDVHEL